MYRSNKVYLVILGVFICLVLYGMIGMGTRVDEIKERAPQAMSERGWEIMRYEGWQYGSFMSHGGKVWYHVRNAGNHTIQYRVYVTLWADELHFIYGEPERLQRIDVNLYD